MITKNQITTYCLLAHVNDNDRGIKDLSQIFIPLVKKTLTSLVNRGVSSGKKNDIKIEFDKLFGLDIPYNLLQKFMRQIEDEVNQPDTAPFVTVHEDGSFILTDFKFTELDEVLNQQSADVGLTEDSYKEFIERAGLKIEEEPSVFEFLDSHHQELSRFFLERTEFETAEKYTTPALFVDSLKNDEKMFNILRRIYLGSLISSYLQLPIIVEDKGNKELLLDTSFIISLLDLRSEEAYHTCQMVLEIALKLGWKITILNITLDETKALLERSADSIGTISLPQLLPPASIEGACARRRLSRTELLRIANSLTEKLKKEFRVKIFTVSEQFSNKARETALYKKIIGRTHNPDGAHHDGVANYYVAKKRRKNSRNLFETSCWFVSSNDSYLDNNVRIKGDGSFYESIRAEYLLNVMWLSSPSARLQEIPTIALSKLVAATIERSLPSHVVLRDFNDNLNKLGPDELSVEDIALVANSAAIQSTKKLEDLNALAQTNTEQFSIDIISIADTERERTRKLQQNIIQEQKLRSEVERKHKESEDKLRKVHSELYEMRLNEIMEIENNIKLKEMAFGIAVDRFRFIKPFLIILSLTILAIIEYLAWLLIDIYDWSVLEPNVFLLGFGLPLFLAVLGYAIPVRKDKKILEIFEEKVQSWLIQKHGTSESIINDLKEQLISLKDRIKQIPVE